MEGMEWSQMDLTDEMEGQWNEWIGRTRPWIQPTMTPEHRMEWNGDEQNCG